MMLRDADAYNNRVRDGIRRHASTDFSLEEAEAAAAAAKCPAPAAAATPLGASTAHRRERSSTGGSLASSASANSSDGESDMQVDAKLPARLRAAAGGEDDGNESDVSILSDV